MYVHSEFQVNFTAALSTFKLAAEEIKVCVIQELVQS